MSSLWKLSTMKRLKNSIGRIQQQQQRLSSVFSGNKKKIIGSSPVVLVGISLVTGISIGRWSKNDAEQNRVLPNGLPRTCCADEGENLSELQRALPSKLRRVLGPKNVLDGLKRGGSSTILAPYLTGARLGSGGSALCVLTPRSLQEVATCVKLIVDADCVILPQGSNTGLTGGSVPRVVHDGRPVVVISMKYLDSFFPIDGGKRVVCMAGAGLADLSRDIPTWFPDRESHSILGSTFLNPTTAAGVAFGSGGTQLRKGPAYTDRAMYIKVQQNKFGENVVKVVNRLGINGIEDKDFHEGSGNAVDQLEAYQRDVKEGYSRAMVTSSRSPNGQAKAHDTNYATHVCKNNEDVSRYNADCSGLECNRSEGKVLILATVHDTFPSPAHSRHFWISFADLETALAFRREVCLQNAKDLPVSVEYMNRDSFDVIDTAGRGQASIIQLLGVSSPYIKHLWNIKLWIESLPITNSNLWCDQFLYYVNSIFPETLPKRMMESGTAMDHHVAMTVGEFGDGNMKILLDRLHTFASNHDKEKIVIHECQSSSEAQSLTAFRFVAASAFRTWCVGNDGAQGISVDYALPKNGGQIPKLTSVPLKRMRYSHFGCNVVHEDLAYGPNVDVEAAKLQLKRTVEIKKGKLPAEHGHGTEYHAPKPTQKRWKQMDPLNVFNPGVGGLSTNYKYKE